MLSMPVAAMNAQGTRRTFTHADTLRGSNTPQRSWWDVTFYDLHVSVLPADSSIRGWNGITYLVKRPAHVMQIDLQVPLVVDSMVQEGRSLAYRRDGNALFVTLVAPQRTGAHNTIDVYYHGQPRVATNPPWDGGFTWKHDSLGNRWIATSNEGIGASVWWPNKDYLADEPDSQRIAITVPDSLQDVSNGRLRSTTHNADSTTTYEWFVDDPINNYDVEVNAGRYAHFSETYQGEAGPLTMDFWPLAYHLDTAKVQFQQARSMMQCFEHWFGPYPWYKDGYKLIEAPYLGMEHQSGVTYGNRYANGYLGRDLSHTGWGLKWDFIIVHESAHEWWGNNITDRDAADMWIHESFGMYAEALYLECTKGREAGERYLVGLRSSMIRNDMPIIGTYGVNDVPRSQDRYPKGANMLMTMRAVVHDDAKWLATLRGLNSTFRHQTVTAKQVRDYMSKMTGTDLSKIFVQYQETVMIPELEYRVNGDTLSYRWTRVIPGFDMPVDLKLAGDSTVRIRPTETWQSMRSPLAAGAALEVDPAYYVTAKETDTP